MSFRSKNLIWVNLQAVQTFISCQGWPSLLFTSKVASGCKKELTSRVWGWPDFCVVFLFSLRLNLFQCWVSWWCSLFHWLWEDRSFCQCPWIWTVASLHQAFVRITEKFLLLLNTKGIPEGMTLQAEHGLDYSHTRLQRAGIGPICIIVCGSPAMSIASYKAALFCSLCSSRPSVCWPTESSQTSPLSRGWGASGSLSYQRPWGRGEPVLWSLILGSSVQTRFWDRGCSHRH